MDVDVFTPSDFCLMAWNLQFKDNSPDAIQDELKKTIEEQYNIDDIQYINPAYDIADFYSNSEKLSSL